MEDLNKTKETKNTIPETDANVKSWVDELSKIHNDQRKTIEKNSAGISKLTELVEKTGHPDKLVKDPLEDEKVKKMNARMDELEDKLKTDALRREASVKFGSVEGLAKSLTSDKDANQEANWRLAKSILEDPHGAEYSKAWKDSLFSVGHRRTKAQEKLGEIVDKIMSSSTDQDESFIKKSLNSITGEDGSYLAPPEIDLAIQKILFESSPLRSVASVMITNRRLYEFYIRTTLPKASWGSTELGTDENTDTQKYEVGRIPVHELQAEPRISLNQLEDSQVNLENELKNDLAEAFMLSENDAFINGGTKAGSESKQPLGLKYYSSKGSDTPDNKKPLRLETLTVANADFTADTLLNLEAKLFSSYKNKAYWLMSRQSKNTIRQLKDGNGQYLFSLGQNWGGFEGVPKIRDGINGRINGYPILEVDDADNLGAAGYPIWFGDFSKYCIIDRIGMQVIMDNITTKGWVKYFTRKRVGGGLKFAQGIKALKLT